MESMLRINKIKSKQNVRGLRTLYSHIENCVRNLKALKLDSASYGSLLISILKDRLPDELNMIISRQFGGSVWILEKVMEYLKLREPLSIFTKYNGNSENKHSEIIQLLIQ